jgi:ABC-type thiamine transport system ATPase subunit
MQAVLAIRNLFRQPKPILLAENPFSAPDRAALNLMCARAEQVEAARRYWACPF